MKYIIYTREERFDLYGKCASILVPLKIEGDYEGLKQPNCFRLNGLKPPHYEEVAKKFKAKYHIKYLNKRYKNDEVYREKSKTKSRLAYAKKKKFIDSVGKEFYKFSNNYFIIK